MKHVISITLGMFFVWGLLALTPMERKAVQSALGKVKQAQTDYSSAQQSTIEAWDYASRADLHAWETEQKIAPIQAQVDASHKNEEALAVKVGKYEPFYVFGHKYWGIGSIIAGFGILATHLLILAAFIILLLLAFWALSLVFPVLGPIVSIGTGFVSRLWARIRKK